MKSTTAKTSAQKQSKPTLWADRVPLSWKPYVQLTRIDLFAGSLMIFWPYVWTLPLVRRDVLSHYSQYIPQAGIWLVWSIILHSVGSTWNDICDVDFDRQVERTKTRPLPSGAVSIRAAYLWMVPQIAILMGILFQFNIFTVQMGMVQMFVLTTIYPFAKRYTYIPQAWLGFTIGWGAIVAWSANSDRLNWEVVGLMLATVMIWVTYIDTFYAMLDKKDDAKAGVKSSALLFGDNARAILAFLATLFVGGMAKIGHLLGVNTAFYYVAVLGSALHFLWQLYTADFDDPKSCMMQFNSNLKSLGGLTMAGILLG
ncbi:hypothetical protein HYPSUDRAFT_78789 [Hypholoma sublateritium FD-334 SS-4]|uniref:4-hydroxybenzoate polyprenyltransferase n=1 Tax=Hypholoma sublateritium (strain FD-334 SS-4) TaxID=945553 RepID=A0A0D2KYA0_HYPSF|nr:hypothetical protein HYPSUDRAFT_78789 [Hypholoma sublateritium FD-334 SS-4]